MWRLVRPNHPTSIRDIRTRYLDTGLCDLDRFHALLILNVLFDMRDPLRLRRFLTCDNGRQIQGRKPHSSGG